jgi:hypothetical protein
MNVTAGTLRLGSCVDTLHYLLFTESSSSKYMNLGFQFSSMHNDMVHAALIYWDYMYAYLFF